MTELAEVVKGKSKGTDMALYIEKQRPHFERALGKTMDVDKFVRTVWTQLRTIPNLPQCTTESVFGGALLAAQTGLSLNSVQGHAWLVPFWSSTKKVFEAQFVLGYRGVAHLAWNSGRVKDISAREVYANDHFEYEYGLRDKLVHRPARGDRGEIEQFYAMARFVGTGHVFNVITLDDAKAKKEQALKKAKNPGNPELPWNKYFNQMAMKSAFLPMKAWLPLSPESQRAIDADEAVITPEPDSDGGWTPEWDDVIDMEGEEQ